MGAGKSAVGRQLARLLHLDFIDSDEEIESRTGVDIPFIFEKEGEDGFRRRETDVVDELTGADDAHFVGNNAGALYAVLTDGFVKQVLAARAVLQKPASQTHSYSTLAAPGQKLQQGLPRPDPGGEVISPQGGLPGRLPAVELLGDLPIRATGHELRHAVDAHRVVPPRHQAIQHPIPVGTLSQAVVPQYQSRSRPVRSASRSLELRFEAQ